MSMRVSDQCIIMPLLWVITISFLTCQINAEMASLNINHHPQRASLVHPQLDQSTDRHTCPSRIS